MLQPRVAVLGGLHACLVLHWQCEGCHTPPCPSCPLGPTLPKPSPSSLHPHRASDVKINLHQAGGMSKAGAMKVRASPDCFLRAVALVF